MSSASRAGEEGAPHDLEVEEDRRSLGDPAKEERANRRCWVNQAYDDLHLPTADDATRPPHLNTGRKRLDWMINHRTLNPEDVIDRGVPVDKSFRRFGLRVEFLEMVDLVISYTQKVLGVIAPAAAEDPSETLEYWEFDPQGVLRDNLAGAHTLPDLNFAWTMFNQRCSAALSKYRKLRARAEGFITGETPPSMSPTTTPGSVYKELPQLTRPEDKLKFLWGAVPSYSAGAKDAQSTWSRARFLSTAPEDLVRPPSPLMKAFPLRLPERDPLTRYYDGDQARERAFGKEFTPWSGSLPVRAYEEKWNPAPEAKKEKGLKFQKQADDDPSANHGRGKAKKKESESRNWRERDPSFSGEAVSLYGSLSTRRLDFMESASRAGSSRKKRSRSRKARRKKETEGDNGGKESRKLTAGPPRRPNPGGKDPAPHVGKQPGDDPSDGEEDEDDDEDSSSSDEEEAVVDLDEGEELPLLPYGTTAPTVLASIKPDQLPAWDGNKATAHEFLAAIYEYANSGGYMNQAVGYWLWTRLEKGSAVFQWYVTLSPTLKNYMRRSAHNFLGVVQRDYLGPKWIRNLATEFQFQSFREYKHRNESPSQFVYRRIISSRALAFAPKNSKEEVRMVLSVAPPSWGIVLVPSSIDSTDTLTRRVLQFEDELANAARSTSHDIRSQVASALKELGVSASVSSRARFPPRRPEGASAFNVEEQLETSPMGVEDAPSEEYIANEMLAVAYSVAAARDKVKSAPKPRFARRDDVKSKKKPPAPCRPCGSPFHWNRDCPHWNEYLSERRAEGHLVETEDSDAERAYNVAYYLCGQDFEQAARVPAGEGNEQERKTSHAEKEGEPEVYVVRAQSFVSRIEEIEDDYWYEGELLPADSPHILESIYEGVEEAERTSVLKEEVYAAIGMSEEEAQETLGPHELTAMPKPYAPAKVKLHPRARKNRSAGGESHGVLCIRGHLGSEDEVELDLRIDSCASRTFVSVDHVESLKRKPAIKQGAQMKLLQLTETSAPIKGSTRLSVVVRMDDGTLVEMEGPMFVVEGMTVPVLLGEDFQQAYEMSVSRSVEDGTVITFGPSGYTKTAIPAARSQELQQEVLAVERACLGEQPSQHFLKKAARHRWQKNFKAKKKALKEDDYIIRAAEDVTLRPETVVKVAVTGPFAEGGEWVVEKEMISATNERPFLVPNALVAADNPVIPVANTATIPRRIRKGEALGRAQRVEDFFDKPESLENAEKMRKHASFLSEVCKVRERGASEAADKAQRARDKVDSKYCMPEKSNYEAWRKCERSFPMPDAETYESWKNSFAEQARQEPTEDESEEVGPKTAEMPDTTDVSSSEFRQVLDVGNLPTHLEERAWCMLEERKGAFALDGKLGNHPAMAKIRTQEGTQPIALPLRSSSPAKKAVMDEQIEKWFEQDVIEASRSPWSAPVVIAYRNGKPRFCVDYRKLNAATIPDEFPIPRQQEILASLAGSQVLSSLDALSGFTQLRLDPQDVEKTAFRTHRGLFQFKRMPFGLRNGPSIFQRVMQSVLAPYLWLFALVYIDDIVVYSKSFEEHIDHLNKVLQAVEEANITLSPKKCHLFYDSIILLGHKVSRLGLSTHYEKVKAVLEMKRPSTVAELQTFLGMLVYFNSFIPYYSDVCGPLHELLRKGTRWKWGAEQEYAFLQAKKALQRAPVLGHPMEGRPYRLYTDASDHALGCALQQVQPIKVGDLKGTAAYTKIKDAFERGAPVPKFVTKASSRASEVPESDQWGASLDETTVHVERVIAYWSRTFKGAEARYSTTEREALAAKEGLVKFQPYLEGSSVLLITDHSALQWARTYENSNRRLASWGAVFSAYRPGLEIVHRAGRVHSNVDPLSRIPREPPPFVTPNEPRTPPIRTDAASAALQEEKAARARAEKAFVGLSIGECLEDSPEAYCAQLRRSARLARRGADEVETQRHPEELTGAAETGEKDRRRKRQKQRTEDAQNLDEQDGRVEEDGNSSEEEDNEVENVPQRPAYEATFRRPPALAAHLSKELAEKFRKAYQNEAVWKRRYEEAGTVSSAWVPGRRYYRSEDGLLFFLDADYLPRLCVPDALVDEVMRRAHEEPMETAHAGAAKLWGKLHPRFFWRRMKKRIEQFCGTCDVCQKVKYATFKKYGTLIPNPIPAAPYESVSMDFVVGLPLSEGYDAILVVVDRLTKHAQFIPTTTGINRIDAAKLFVRYVASRYGIPASIVSDQDPKWASDFWEQVAKELHTDLLMSTSHHAQTDGQTEIVNRFMETMLRAYVAVDQEKWAEFLPLVEFAYNSTVHRSTGETPFHLLMGYHPRSPMSFWNNSEQLYEKAQRVPEAQRFLEELRIRREQARDAIAVAQDEQARIYNRGRKPVPEFKKGDKVLVNPHSLEWIESEGRQKLRQRWIGPFEIQQRINPNVYRLRMDDRYPGLPIFNFEHLKPYREGNSSVEAERAKLPTTRPDKLEGDEYEVGKILEHRWNRSKRKREYLVRWKGYGPHYDTWQVEYDLRNAPDTLAEYKREKGL